MKKSQILAALALAFALGVVAPVVSVSDTYAFTEANSETHTEGKATKKDVETVVAAIKAEYPIAERMNKLDELVNGTDKITTASDIEATSGVANVASDIVDAIKTINTSYDDSRLFENVDNYVKQINTAIAAVNNTNVVDYSTVSAIFAAIDAKDDAALRTALGAFNAAFNANVINDSSVTVANYDTTAKAAVTAAIVAMHDGTNHGGHPTTATYDNYEALYEAVKDATEARDTYTEDYTALRNALTAGGVLNDAGLVALGNNDRATNPKIEALLNMANDTNTNNMTGWNTFYDKLAGTYAIDADSNVNYNNIISLTTDLKGLAKITDKTPVEIAQGLLGYTGPVDTLPEKPADKEDGNKVPGAGNTGAVAGADATAKATVSIMAAIASVATAAFVAIRKIAAGKKA